MTIFALARNRVNRSIAHSSRGIAIAVLCLAASPLCAGQAATAASQPRVIEVTADGDSQYRIHGQSKPVITVTAGEPLTLRITAIKAKSKNRDGSIHGFALLRAKDHHPVDGWDFALRPGINVFNATAPYEPGEYVVVCTVICSEDHEQMNMKFVVLPSGS